MVWISVFILERSRWHSLKWGINKEGKLSWLGCEQHSQPFVFRYAGLTTVFVYFCIHQSMLDFLFLILESLCTFMSNKNTKLWNPIFPNQSLDFLPTKLLERKLVHGSNGREYSKTNKLRWIMDSNLV